MISEALSGAPHPAFSSSIVTEHVQESQVLNVVSLTVGKLGRVEHGLQLDYFLDGIHAKEPPALGWSSDRLPGQGMSAEREGEDRPSLLFLHFSWTVPGSSEL